MNIDHQRRYESSSDFFALGGSIVMKLTADAAIEVRQHAAQRGMIVSRIEGGIWHFPGFEARLDCIWDGTDSPVDMDAAERNNALATAFILSERPLHDIFIITAPSVLGWRYSE